MLELQGCDLTFNSQPGGGTHIKNDGGAPTDASNQGAIGDDFFAKKGVIG